MKNDMRKQRLERKLLLYRLLFIIFAVILLIAGGVYIRNQLVKRRARLTYEELAKKTTEFANGTGEESQNLPDTETETGSNSPYISEEGVPVKYLDWDMLHEINADIYAWIYIPNTNIDYPLLQHPTEESYYLEHNLDGSAGKPGCIYSQRLNSKDFTDYNTVLYGHNMEDGTMFHTLHNFEEADFFEQNRYIYIYTQEKVLIYEIFAAYRYSDEHILYSYDFESKEGFQAYLDDVFAVHDINANFRENMGITTDNHIITLSTCVAETEVQRLLVQGVLVNEPA